ncbi:protein FAR1-RELATED SEQUENCE 5-like [Citrus sinensis]|uniref:protein FAR1-RELATED SEQUENCE 5-like n=1 Tax=Citrus clementina TaxID=85681 RepID=UPI000CED0EC7|nr:protein FAR1-RELATED SEQUENCE 5-like [Citrus x clementina]XP_052287209.1 protein FAR1-RELATED SEQUENCE 5-like [Citrus sinensis]
MKYLENEHAFEELQEIRANDVNEIVEPNKCEPALGMLFDNHEEMFAFYKAYGKKGVSCEGIRIAQNFNSIIIGASGYENESFLEKDCRNFIAKTRRLQLEEGDAMTLLKYFQKKQAEYSQSRAAYKYFGDVITFDTTYLTNKYDMPFAPFVGVNHHGQSILLGCGLISCEDTETFTWLFEAWLSCMSDSPPIGIITDQDRAIQRAIESVFLTTKYRWCLWHIMKKVPEKLGAFKEREGIISSLLSTVYDSLSSDAFEEAWHCMITKYDLWDNDWLNDLYEERHRWVSCYLKGYFWAGMSTTQ